MAEHQDGGKAWWASGGPKQRRVRVLIQGELCEFDDVADFTGLAVVTPRFAFLRRYGPLTR